MIFNKKKNVIVLVIVSLIIVVLLGGNQLTIVKETELVREVLAQKFPSEAEKRRRIALWVVQHFDVPEPIKEVKVSKIKSYGLFGTGGRATSVIINSNEKYIVDGISVEKNGNVRGGAIYDDRNLKYIHDPNRKKDLSGIKISCWEKE